MNKRQFLGICAAAMLTPTLVRLGAQLQSVAEVPAVLALEAIMEAKYQLDVAAAPMGGRFVMVPPSAMDSLKRQVGMPTDCYLSRIAGMEVRLWDAYCDQVVAAGGTQLVMAPIVSSA